MKRLRALSQIFLKMRVLRLMVITMIPVKAFNTNVILVTRIDSRINLYNQIQYSINLIINLSLQPNFTK